MPMYVSAQCKDRLGAQRNGHKQGKQGRFEAEQMWLVLAVKILPGQSLCMHGNTQHFGKHGDPK